MAEHKMEKAEVKANPEKPNEEVEVKQVIPSTVKKPSLAKKFAGTFFKGNLQSAASYVFDEIIIPKSKDIISDVAYQMIQSIVYGDEEIRSTANRRSPYISYNKVSSREERGGNYSNRYSSSRREPSIRNKHHDFYDFGYDYEDQAKEVISELIDIFERNGRSDSNNFGYVTVADLYKITGMQTSFMDYRWGWTELNDYPRQYYKYDARAKQYFLNLPPTENLDEARKMYLSDRWD